VGNLSHIKQQMASLPPAKTMAEVERAAKTSGEGGDVSSVGEIGQPVPAPASSYKPVRGGEVFQASVPSNWETLSSQSSIKFVPPNGYGTLNGQQVFTHGAEAGVVQPQSRNLSQATSALLEGLAAGNPDLHDQANPQQVRLSGRTAIHHRLTNRSATGKQEDVGLYTAFLGNGNLFYLITVAPANESDTYDPTFRRIASSIQLLDQ